jgi:hypothetical protein
MASSEVHAYAAHMGNAARGWDGGRRGCTPTIPASPLGLSQVEKKSVYILLKLSPGCALGLKEGTIQWQECRLRSSKENDEVRNPE